MSHPKTSVIVLAGLSAAATGRIADEFLAQEPGTIVINHDLRDIGHGVVLRRIRDQNHDTTTVLELAHGCVSCTLREDLLPLLLSLAASRPPRVVIQADPSMEPETLCWAMNHVLISDRTVADEMDIEAVVAVIDQTSWLADATCDDDLIDRGLAGAPNDERGVAQLAVAHVEFADAVVVEETTADAVTVARTKAVLDRLAPLAVQTPAAGLHLSELLDRLPTSARRGEPDGPHGPLLRGQPPLHAEAGVELVFFGQRRPFHPQRLHDAIDVLLHGVIRVRGRVWVASQPDVAMWLESTNGGLQLGHAGPWLVGVDQAEWGEFDPERQAVASMNWDPYYGDRMQELAILTETADPAEILATLDLALLTDAELAHGEAEWRTYPDPFGFWHTEPCDDLTEGAVIADSASLIDSAGYKDSANFNDSTNLNDSTSRNITDTNHDNPKE